MKIGTRSNPDVLLTALRCVGGGAFLAPSLGCATFDIKADASARYVIRLFAARNITLAMGLGTSQGDRRRQWLQMGLLCDALDIVAGVMGLREGKDAKSATLDTGLSTLALALGIAGIRAHHA